MKTTINIVSDKQISEDVKKKIQDIFKESECPNESLRSISGFSKFDGNFICFGVKGGYVETIEVERRD